MGILRNLQHECAAQARAKGSSEVDAYAKAGYKSCDANAARLFKRKDVKARVDELMNRAVARTEITVERVLREMGCIAFADPRRIFNDDHDLRPMSEWPDDLAPAIASITKTATGTLTVRLCDKSKALEMLGRSLAMFKDKLEINRPTDDMTDVELATYIEHLRSQLGRTGA